MMTVRAVVVAVMSVRMVWVRMMTMMRRVTELVMRMRTRMRMRTTVVWRVVGVH